MGRDREYNSNADRQRAYRLRRAAELRRLRQGKPEPPAKKQPATKTAATDLSQELAEARKEIARLTDELAAAKTAAATAKPAKPKAKKAPLPPDEVHERRIKALTTEVRNLKQLLSVHERRYVEGIMPRKTRNVIDRVLHPDSTATEADRDEACKGWNVWKNDNDKARRHRA